MPPMEHVWHFVDRSCRPDAVAEAQALAESGRLVWVGTQPERHSTSQQSPWLVMKNIDLARLCAAAPEAALPVVMPRIGRAARRRGSTYGTHAHPVLQCWSVKLALAVAESAKRALAQNYFITVLRLTSPLDASEATCLGELSRETRLLVVADSESLRAQARSACPPSFSSAGGALTIVTVMQMMCIPPIGASGVHLARRVQLRKQCGLAAGDIVLAVPPAVTATSGHYFAFWATDILHVAEFPVKLVLPADPLAAKSSGPYRELVRFASQCGSGDCLMPAELSGAEVAAIGDVLLLGDEQELSAFQAAQALSVGKPIVATDTPSARALLGDAALFVPGRSPRALAQALLRLIEHPEAAASLTEKARLGGQQFEAAGVREQWTQLYGGLSPSSHIEASVASGR